MSTTPYAKHEVVEFVRRQRARTLTLLESISETDWEQEVTPGWRVREVAAHLITSDEGALTGRMLTLGLRAGIPALEAWNDEQVARWNGRPIASMLIALDRWGRRICRALSILPEPLARKPLPTPLGTVSMLWIGMMRVYDEWVHDEDVRRALGLDSDGSPEAITPVVRQMFAAIPVQTLPNILRSSSGSVSLVCADLDVRPFGIDLDSRRYGFGVAGEATVTASGATLVMIAARRDPWREVQTAGDLRIEGNRAAAEVVLDALLVV